MKTINSFINVYIINGQEVRDYVAYEYYGINNYHLISADENNNRVDVTSKEMFESLVKDKNLDELLTAEELNEVLSSQIRRPE